MILEKLSAIQQELKAPKNQINKFGGFNYRSCEDVLEALKPLLKKYNCTLTISDEMINQGDRYYIKATATLYDNGVRYGELGGFTQISAFARESTDKKGMDASQLTGTASSYARKYALNGLFLIDDTKDADTDEFKGKEPKATAGQIADIKKLSTDLKSITTYYKVENVEDLTLEQANTVIKSLKGAKDGK